MQREIGHDAHAFQEGGRLHRCAGPERTHRHHDRIGAGDFHVLGPGADATAGSSADRAGHADRRDQRACRKTVGQPARHRRQAGR